MGIHLVLERERMVARIELVPAHTTHPDVAQ